MKGILLVDKPAGMTSHDVVDHIRKASGIRRVGHTGTLDPSATGLLILCLGPATRLSEHLTGLDKVYEGDMRLGVVTRSYDMDGEVMEEHPIPPLTPEQIQTVLDRYTGDLLQEPPMVSAVKVGGERLYKRARKGETVERTPRPITVREFRVLSYTPPLVHFRVACTSGTYVRSLCHDAGQDLECGAALDSLRRISVGRYHVKDASPVDVFANEDDVRKRLVSLNTALDLPEVIVRAGGRRLISSGSTLRRQDLKTDCPVSEGWVQVKAENGELLALAQVQKGPEPIINPRRVFIRAS